MIGATWAEIDVEAREWRIPAKRMKGRQRASRDDPPLSRGQALAPLAAFDAQQHALGIDIADLERDHFRDAQSGAVGDGERRLVLCTLALLPPAAAVSPPQR